MTRHEPIVAAAVASGGERAGTARPKVAVYSDLAALPAGFDALFAAGAKQSVFLSRPWFANLAATVVPGRGALRLYALEGDDGTPLALLPMLHGTDQPRLLRALAAPYTCYFAPLVNSGGLPRREALAAIAGAIRAERPAWAAVRLDFLPHDDAAFADLCAAFRAAGYAVGTYRNFGNWYEPIETPTLDAYLARRPSVLRNTVKRKAKKLDKLGTARFETITEPDAVAAGLAAYDKVYAASWKQPEAVPAFIPGLMHALAAAGWLRLGIAHVGGEAAAAQLWIVCNGKAVIYKLAYDERFEALSVGSILTLNMARHAIEVDRVREIDYGSGDDAYKRDWMSGRRELWGVIAFNPATWRGLAGLARHGGGRVLARLCGFLPQRLADLARVCLPGGR